MNIPKVHFLVLDQHLSNDSVAGLLGQNDYADAIDQNDQWLSYHPLKGDQAMGLNNRCWLRAAANRDLHDALDDCNGALTLGNLRDAVRDYNSALHINSNMSSALYGRGLAELRLGEKAQGHADLAAAEKLEGGIAQRFASMGLAP